MALNCDIYTFVVCRFFLLSIVSCGHFYCCLLVVWHILIAACVQYVMFFFALAWGLVFMEYWMSGSFVVGGFYILGGLCG